MSTGIRLVRAPTMLSPLHPEVRRLDRLTVGWALLADFIPLYPLYALPFADAGLSDARISTLLLLWTAVGILAEVPAGALADRFSRRGALAVGSLFQAAAYALWTAAPGYPAFATGFVLWGLGGVFRSGALEALLYDGLASVGGEDYYPRLSSRVTAVSLLCQLPTAAAATLLFTTGGYPLAVGPASPAAWPGPPSPPASPSPGPRRHQRIAAPATRTPTPTAMAMATVTPERTTRPTGTPTPTARPTVTPARTTRATPTPMPMPMPTSTSTTAKPATSPSCATACARRPNPAVRVAVVAVAVLGGLDGIDEYFPLFARDWGIDASLVPMAMVGIPLAGAAGAALGGPASRLRPRSLTLMMALAVGLFCGAALLHRPVGMAGVSVAYGLYQLVLVVTNARLQARIVGPSRATVTSVASLGTELSAAVFVGAWAIDRPWLVAGVAVAVTAALPRLLRDDRGTEPMPGGMPIENRGPR